MLRMDCNLFTVKKKMTFGHSPKYHGIGVAHQNPEKTIKIDRGSMGAPVSYARQTTRILLFLLFLVIPTNVGHRSIKALKQSDGPIENCLNKLRVGGPPPPPAPAKTDSTWVLVNHRFSIGLAFVQYGLVLPWSWCSIGLVLV